MTESTTIQPLPGYLAFSLKIFSRIWHTLFYPNSRQSAPLCFYMLGKCGHGGEDGHDG
jgi:hypothetical protein